MNRVISRYFFTLFAITSFVGVSAQPGGYKLAAVPDALKLNASIVTHLQKTEITIESIDKTTVNVHKIYTVVNEDDKSALFFQEYTSKYVSLEDAEIKVFDANGKQTGKHKKKDMSTVAIGEGLVEDGYVTYYRIVPDSYPVTVEVNYKLSVKSTLTIPDYLIQHPKEGVEQSHFSVRIPSTLVLRYKANNTSITPEIKEDGKYKIYSWSAKNLSPVEDEAGSVDGRNNYPYIQLVANNFSHYGYEGDLSSWKNFGLWIRDLYKGLDVLPASTRQNFATMTSDANNNNEKIKRIYQYLQTNFRYVSIQLGIGGLKPFSAEFTDSKKYGDCKALSNYMKAALQSVGIKSHVAIINSSYNTEPVDPEFPTNDFNHVILCVPNEKDTVWVECTSSTATFGKLGTFTENKNALLITDDGGVLVATPKSRAADNTLSARTTVTIATDLSATTEALYSAEGEYLELLSDLHKQKKDRQKEMLVYYFGFKQPDAFVLSKESNSQSKFRMDLFKVSDFAAGNKIFITPRLYKFWSSTLPKADKRKFDFYFRYPFTKTDTTIFKLPADSKVASLPKEVHFRCDFAEYSSKYWHNTSDNTVYSTATLTLKNHKIPAAGYASVKKFFMDLSSDEAQKIVVEMPEVKRGF